MSIAPSAPVVLVTGSSHGGIGYSLCEEFAAKGCIVYASARRLETISSFSNPSIRPLIMDVTSDDSVHKAVEQVVEETGRVDIVVANAGITCFGPILDVSIDHAKQALDTNVLGVLRLAKEVFPHMATRKRGTFITIGSVSGANPSPWVGMYAATKAAAHGVTETLQMEAKALGPDIKVMLVLTGGVRCEAFAARGCIVYASARRLEAVSSSSHPSIRPLIMDVTSDSSVQKGVEKVIEEAGRVDVVVANAGIACHGPVLDIPIDQAKGALDTNVLGVLRLAQAVFPYMASRKKGTFITTGSVAGPTPTPWSGVYAATKAAAHAITETLQMEAKALSPDIRVMLVLTGGVKCVTILHTIFPSFRSILNVCKLLT
ncbi:unnamed protein product [Rhizoctonia solani]|uniref:NAD(P)-binding protein n=1 Tax=Rhizoctonia solani TaxID=456999 RepID=A0A8H3HZL1_9AGAM|nr:unnamed protein product [Rhizoctonia solani]